MLKLILLLISATVLITLVLFIFWFRHKCTARKHDKKNTDTEKSVHRDEKQDQEKQQAKAKSKEEIIEKLITFEGGEELTINEILEAPGEVIAKSHHGTLYKASLQSQTMAMRRRFLLLRFLKPNSSFEVEDSIGDFVRFLGCIRHPNLVPLLGFYEGHRREKLLVHPFYARGNLADFIRGSADSKINWGIIQKIYLGIAKGLDHLHTGLEKPVIHGNLNSKNILLDKNYEPHISDFSLHLLLNPKSNQQKLEIEISAANNNNPPELDDDDDDELINISHANQQTDIYSFGVILLQLISANKDPPMNRRPDDDDDDDNDDEQMNHKCLFELAMACCSSSPDLRPNSKQVLAKLQEIRK